jgi:hypothetical protein
MKYKLFLLLLYFLIRTLNAEEVYCDSEHYCSNCTYCGINDDNYCSCNFYNNYCLKNDSTKNYFSEFLKRYDGCISSNGNKENICGSSSIILDSGESKTINFKSTNSYNFLCYYNVQKSENNDNRMGYSVRINGNSYPNFKLFLIIYYSNKPTKTVYLTESSVSKSAVDIEEIGCQKMSIYLDVEDPKYLNELSIIVTNKGDSSTNTTPGTSTSTSKKSSSGSKVGLIVGIIVGALALIIGIIIAVILTKKCKTKENNNTNNSANNMISNNNNQYINAVNSNKAKMDNLFKTELLPNVYKRNNVINDNYNCTICMEDFIDNSSMVITTKCGHTFHEQCFKKLINKNLICPKCPNCNYLFLGPESEIIMQNITMPSTYGYNNQTFNTTLGVTQ